MPNSMTGFARQQLRVEWGELSCEIRSVNHRYLEPSIRLPELLRPCETIIRDLLRSHLHRGKVEVSLQYNIQLDSKQGLALNTPVVDALLGAVDEIKQRSADIAPMDALRLLQWPGVVQEVSLDEAQLEQMVKQLATEALNTLKSHRQREGEELKRHIEERLDLIAEQVVLVRKEMPEILQAQREKMQQKVSEFVAELDENRLEHEMALLATKSDVAEELDRLETHLKEVRHILSQKGAIGRRLDFMMQELNREANTLSSKSLATSTTQAAVSIKVLIEQMREQVQNIE